MTVRTLKVEVADDAAAAARCVTRLIADRARVAIEERGAFTLALSRGAELAARVGEEDLPWPRVSVFQVDERIVPLGNDDRNLGQLLAALPHDAVRPLPVDETNVEAAADRYAAELPGRLDLVHLGLGADGHVASLFPRSPSLAESQRRVLAVTAPKPPPERLTVTPPVIRAARLTIGLVAGAGKSEALARALDGPDDADQSPGRLARDGLWMVDTAAAARLAARR